MKKKILSFLTALAVAAFCIIAPAKSGVGLDILAEASDTEGLSVEALNGANIEALEAGDEFIVRLKIPAGLVTELLDTLELNIKFNSDAFAVVDWYDADDPGMVNGATSESAGVKASGEDGYSYLSYAAIGAASPTNEHTIDITAGLTLEATLKVRTDVSVKGGSYEFEIITAADLFQCGYFDPSYIGAWDLTPANAKAIAKVANTISGKITGIDFTQFGAGQQVVVALYDGTTLIAEGDVNHTTGRFTITAAPEDANKTYDMKIRVEALDGTLSTLWGIFTERSLYPEEDKSVTLVEPKFASNKLTDKTGIVQIKGSKDVRPIGTFKFRLFGDVNLNGKVDAGDATQVLRYIVGNASAIDDEDDAVQTINMGIANVLDSDAVINAKDATQILRKVIGVSSTFNGRG